MTVTTEHDPEHDAAGPTSEYEQADETAEGSAREEYDHLDDLADGAGCTEVWEHLSGSREE